MGEVLAVADVSTGRRLALKRLLDASDSKAASMFEREYHALGVAHPRIIKVFDTDRRGRAYYTMELPMGRTFERSRRCLPASMPLPARCGFVSGAAARTRLLHRDASPRNVRVTSDDAATDRLWCQKVRRHGRGGRHAPYLPPKRCSARRSITAAISIARRARYCY